MKSPPCVFVAPGTSDGAQEEEIKALFDMIDKDKSGSLSERVVFLSPNIDMLRILKVMTSIQYFGRWHAPFSRDFLPSFFLVIEPYIFEEYYIKKEIISSPLIIDSKWPFLGCFDR